MAITIGGEIWTPPAGMLPEVRDAWATFYRGIWNRYGVLPRQYRDMYIAQHGRCFVCRKAKGRHPDDPRGLGGRRLGVDHNHLSGAVRALVCSGSTSANTCNRLIARYDLAMLRRAVELLETEPAQSVLAVGRDYDSGFFAGHERDTVMGQVLKMSQVLKAVRS